MPYRVKASAAGKWMQGEIISDEDFKADPFSEKRLRTGAVEHVSQADVDKERKAAAEAQAASTEPADLRAQIADLQARLAKLEGNAPPAPTTFDLPAAGEQPNPEQDEVRKAGNEVVQPTASAPMAGEVVPEEAPSGGKKK